MQEKLSVLVTGGAGFIGSHLCRKLLSEGFRVINLDNFDAFYNSQIKRKNIEKELLHKDYILCEGDICNKEEVTRILKKYTPQLIIHLAALAGVRPSIENVSRYIHVNINGTLTLLEAAVALNIKKFIFASSSSVYGDRAKVELLKEDMPIADMISPYAITKKSGEDLAYYFHKQYGIDIIALRFFTVYGPGQRPDLAIHKFVRLISDEATLPMYGDGNTLRDYTYIDDIIEGVTASVNFILNAENLFEIINLSGEHTISLSEMIATIEQALNKKAHIKQMPMQPGDVFFTKGDIGKARQILNYKPQTPFDTGVKNFVSWYKNLSDGKAE